MQINQNQEKNWLYQGLLKTDYSNKITERENKIRSISGLATNAALTAVEK